MKKLHKLVLLILFIYILGAITPLYADNTVKTDIWKRQEVLARFDVVYYKLAARIYQNYIDGIDTTEIALKGFDFEHVDATGTDMLNTILANFDGLYATIKSVRVGDITKLRFKASQDKRWVNSPELEEELDKLIAKASKYKSDRDKLACINDEVVKTCEYTWDFTERIGIAEGALVDKKANCSGFSNAVLEICERLGIINSMIHSTNHRANLIYLDGKWYLWDLTWNVCNGYGRDVVYWRDTSSDEFKLAKGPSHRQWFLVPIRSDGMDRYVELFGADNYLGESQMLRAIAHPESSTIDLSLEDLEVDYNSVQEPEPEPAELEITWPPVTPVTPITPVTPVEDNTETTPNNNLKGSDEEYILDGQGNLIVVKGSTDNITNTTCKAIPTSSKVLINGKQVAFEAYSINGNNYFKLRDLAMALNGSNKQFEVGYDNLRKAISITTGKAYTEVGGELTESTNNNAKDCIASTAKVNVDGKEANMSAYTIGNNNYFKLRDLGKTINFEVSWDGKANTIIVDTSMVYSE